jgi:hypothetical protein
MLYVPSVVRERLKSHECVAVPRRRSQRRSGPSARKNKKKFSVRFEERQARAACRLNDKKTHLAAFFVALAVGIGPADSSGRKKLESFFSISLYGDDFRV